MLTYGDGSPGGYLYSYSERLTSAAIGFLFYNIATAIHVIVLIVNRVTRKKRNELDKMNIQDL
jgi:hypothetical protein